MIYKEKWGEIVADWLWENQKLKKSSEVPIKIFQEFKDMSFNWLY